MDFSYIDAIEYKNNIVVWGRDTDGNLREEAFPLSDFLYAYLPDNTGTAVMKDIFGTPMKRVDFSDKWDFRDWCKTRFNLCESDVPPVYKMLLDKFPSVPEAQFNTLLYDIEVDFDLDDGNGYPTPSNPFGEINSFQAFDTKHKKYVMFIPSSFDGTVDVSDADYPVEIHYTDSERDLLLSVANYIGHIDILCGWYTDGFDLPYIMERAIILFGEKTAKEMFCRDGFPAKKRNFTNEYGEEVWEWSLVGRQHLDMMKLYKKFIPGEKTSFSLDAVCMDDLGESKLDYDDDLGSLYRENPQKFYEYAKQDARLLMLLDNKHQIIRLAMSLAHANCVFASDVNGSVKPIETGFIKFCHERNIVLPDKKDSTKEKFPGAIVYQTISGLWGWVMTVDLTALYPSAMIMLGTSTETLVGQLTGGYADYVSVMRREDRIVKFILESDNETIELPAHELESEIRDNGFTISANGTVFDGRLGLLAEYVQDRFNTRKYYQRLKAEHASAGRMSEADTADLYQKVIKIVCNSLYGCISNAHFRLYDIRLAKSITLTGQVISKWQAYKANGYVEQLEGSL